MLIFLKMGYFRKAARWMNKERRKFRDKIADAELVPLVNAVSKAITGKSVSRKQVSRALNFVEDEGNKLVRTVVKNISRPIWKTPKRDMPRKRTRNGGKKPPATPGGGRGGMSYGKYYKTKGYGPRSLGRRKKRHKMSRACTHGVMYEREFGNVITDTENVYVGHATVAPNEYALLFCCAVVRWLYNKADIPFTKWGDTDASPHEIDIKYRDNLGLERRGTVTSIATVGKTYKVISRELNDLIQDIFLQSGAPGTFLWDSVHNTLESIRMFVPGINPVVVSDLNVLDAKFCIHTKSVLKVQNRTLANHDVADADAARAANNVDHIENNPLVGFRYMVKGKGFLARSPSNVTSGPPLSTVGAGFGANNESGLITARFAETQESRKPLPPTSFQGCNYAKKVLIQPGEIVRDVISSKMDLKANDFLSRFALTYFDTTNGYRRDFKWYGKSSMLGLESVMNSNTNEQPVAISYELNRYTDAYIHTHPNRVSYPLFESAAESAVVQWGTSN